MKILIILQLAARFNQFANKQITQAFFVAYLLSVCETINVSTQIVKNTENVYIQTNDPNVFSCVVSDLQKLV